MAQTHRPETFLHGCKSRRDRGGRVRPVRLPRPAAVLVALGVLALLAAACTSTSASPGVASLGSTTTAPANSAPAGSTGSLASSLKYAECMRSHGLADFPDPDPQGGFDNIPSSASPGSPHYGSASKACQPLLEAGQASATQLQKIQAQLLKFAQCMRSHGVTNYPDPSTSGAAVTTKGLGMSTSSPIFQKAQKACQTGDLKVSS